MTDDAMEFRGLGTVEALVGDRRLPLGGPKQRGLLAILMTNVGEVVPLGRIADSLWPRARPDTGTIYRLASRLRVAVSPAVSEPTQDSVLVGGDGGYRLAVDPERVDIHRFENLLRSGWAELAAGRPETAFCVLGQAMSQWRGPALTGVPESVRFGAGDRLEELRMVAFEERAAAALLCGRHAEVLPDLAERVRAGPIRERVVGLLMAALQQAGRCAEALDFYRSVRERLLAEQAMEPGKLLRDVHRRVLSGEPGLVPTMSVSGAAQRAYVAPRSGLLMGRLPESPEEHPSSPATNLSRPR